MSKTNKIHITAYTILGIIIVVMAIFWYRCAMAKDRLTTTVNNAYDKAFLELTDYISDIDVLLTKAQLASTPAQLASISNKIFMQAAEAKSCFGELPSNNVNLEKTAKFLAQVGDYTYVLSQNMINGQEISQEEYTMLSSLNEYASKLSKNLNSIQNKIYNGEMSFDTANAQSILISAFANEDILGDLENIEKAFEGYPSLIYDGPFSEHIENAQSQMLAEASQISKEEALKKAKNFLGDSGKNLKFETEMNNTAIECYVFGATEGASQISVSVTKKGGYILYYLKNRNVTQTNYDVNSAISTALDYLSSHGFTNMVNSYYEITDNIATINFAYEQNGIKMYSDLIKVRVALDTGEIVGFEAKGYLMNHHARTGLNVILSEDEAKACISTSLDVNAVSLALIPKDSLREVLCYEFHGTFHDKNFIIYVNAENGREEQILLLIESPTGILTI